MKSKNNVQKAILSAIVILTGIAVLNSNTNAQGFWSNRNDNPLAMKTSSNVVLKSKAVNNAALASSVYDLMELTKIEEEAPLKIEDWMVNDFISDKPSKENKNELSTEKRNEVPKSSTKVEKIYKTKTFVYKELEDPELKFEAWMFDNNHWKVK